VTTNTNRRQHERFALAPMYTPITARLLENEEFTLEGHAYNISEGGVQFELDHPIAPGTSIALQITLPTGSAAVDLGPGRSVFVFANIIWIDDEEPGPVRMAAAFTRFARFGDKERLLRMISTGRYSRAA
jgi:hypothetical protein